MRRDLYIYTVNPKDYDYHKLRQSEGALARYCLRMAKVGARFCELQAAGRARVRLPPDEMTSWEDFIGDMFLEEHAQHMAGGMRRLKAEEKRIKKLANDEGFVGIVVEVRPLTGPDKGKWVEVDSCWGFLASDAMHSGYDSDCLSTAVDYCNAEDDAEHFKGFEERAAECLCEV